MLFPKMDITRSKHFRILNAFSKNDASVDFGVRQLTYLETNVLQKVEKDLTYVRMFPVNNTGGAGIKSIEYYMGGGTGEAKQIGRSGKDFPYVDYAEDPTNMPTRNYGIGYKISIDDMEEAQFARKNLDQTLSNQANRGMEVSVNNCMWFGDGPLPGLLSARYKNLLLTLTLANDGTSSSRKLRDKDAAKMERDIVLIRNKIFDAYNGRFEIDTIGLNPSDWNAVMTLKSANAESMLVHEYLRKIGIKNIELCPELSGSNDGIIMYPKTPEVLEARIPDPKKALPVFFDGYNYDQKYKLKAAGLFIYHPQTICYVKY